MKIHGQTIANGWLERLNACSSPAQVYNMNASMGADELSPNKLEFVLQFQGKFTDQLDHIVEALSMLTYECQKFITVAALSLKIHNKKITAAAPSLEGLSQSSKTASVKREVVKHLRGRAHHS